MAPSLSGQISGYLVLSLYPSLLINSSTSVRGTGITCQQHINISIIYNKYYLSTVVRMANHLPSTHWERAFWSPNGGVGSNPTPDNVFFLLYFSVSFVWIQRPYIECYGSQNGLKTCVVLSLETLGGELIREKMIKIH